MTGSVEDADETGTTLPTTGRSLYFTEPRTVSVEPEPVSAPGPDEVLVETRRSAVSSGTELLIYRGEMPRDLPADATLDSLDGDLSYPLKYGYAAVGEVVACGANVDESWRGRRVFAFHPHESHFLATPDALVPVPEDVSTETAALLPTAETATTLAMDGRPRVGERVVVFGAGMVGLVTTSVLSSFPLERLTVVEPVPHRREMATRLGADETLRPEAAATVGERGDPPGADLVYELSGSPETLDGAIDAVGYDGRIVVGSWYGRKRAETDLGGFFHRNRIDVSSSQVSTLAPDLRGRWTKERRLDVAWERLRGLATDRLVTHRIGVGSAGDAYRLLDDGPENALQVLLTYE
ncbi:zinc-dependent alcohol dehydrogenase [Haloplanus halophilus]|uniref:zinc-dependent alcohol dehydrogenase n=1 Tax=Haloplanus halophilus TaxID=2949993 RepID=UPI00203B1E8C|nr:zinc-binding alcohol dehydrogenase [Haloplanus sp. GDY1]